MQQQQHRAYTQEGWRRRHRRTPFHTHTCMQTSRLYGVHMSAVRSGVERDDGDGGDGAVGCVASDIWLHVSSERHCYVSENSGGCLTMLGVRACACSSSFTRATRSKDNGTRAQAHWQGGTHTYTQPRAAIRVTVLGFAVPSWRAQR